MVTHSSIAKVLCEHLCDLLTRDAGRERKNTDLSVLTQLCCLLTVNRRMQPEVIGLKAPKREIMSAEAEAVNNTHTQRRRR